MALDRPSRRARLLPTDPPTGEVPPLPHWTEPPTGAVPAIFADDRRAGDRRRLDVWAPSPVRSRASVPKAPTGPSPTSPTTSPASTMKLGALAERAPSTKTRRSNATSPSAAAATARPGARTWSRRRRGRRGAPVADPPDPRPLPSGRIWAARRGRSRDLPTAIMTAAAVAVVAIVCFTQGTAGPRCSPRSSSGSRRSSSRARCRSAGSGPATLVALVAARSLPIAAQNYGTDAYPVFFGLVVVFSMLWFLWEITPGRPLPGVASTLLVVRLRRRARRFRRACARVARRRRPDPRCRAVRDRLRRVRLLRRLAVRPQPIAPRVSPNKTVEGTRRGHARLGRSSAADRGRRHLRGSIRGRRARARCSASSSRSARSSATSASRCSSATSAQGLRLAAAGPRRRARPLRLAAVLPPDRLLPRPAVQDPVTEARLRPDRGGDAPVG